MVSSTDLTILGLGGLLAVLYLFRDAIFSRGGASSSAASKLGGSGALLANGNGDADAGSDFVAKLAQQVSPCNPPVLRIELGFR